MFRRFGLLVLTDKKRRKAAQSKRFANFGCGFAALSLRAFAFESLSFAKSSQASAPIYFDRAELELCAPAFACPGLRVRIFWKDEPKLFAGAPNVADDFSA